MIEFEQIDSIPEKEFEKLFDRTIFQSHAWINFVAETQKAKPFIAALKEGPDVIGYFTGLIVRKLGFKILGSPLAGWATSYMGFALKPNISRQEAMQELVDFAYNGLGCIHVELMDRYATFDEGGRLGFEHRAFSGFEIDLTQTVDQLFSNMTSACRRCIRKAEKSGVVIEETADIGFADDYYAQLQDVFSRQGLAPTYSKQRVKALIRHLLPTGNLLLLRARDAEGQCIATGIFPGMHDRMYFWGGASRLDRRILRPNEAIQWYAMRYWKKRGICRYDMGGGGEYKRKFGGYEIAVPWFRKSKYRLISKARSVSQKLFRSRQIILGCIQSLRPV